MLQVQEDIIRGYRISPQQRRVWCLQQSGGSQSYRAECFVRVDGALDVAKLKAACREVVERHEILRTHFQCPPEMEFPLQVIDEPGEQDIVEYDLRGWTNSAQKAMVSSLGEELRKEIFDYQTGKLLRLLLVKLEEKAHVLFISLPALCADRTGLENLVRDIGRCYEACLRGAKLEDEPLQYADLSEWLNELFGNGEGGLRNECRINTTLPPFQHVKLPFERRLPKKTDFAPVSLSLPIDPRVSKKIEGLVEKYEASTPIFFLACWEILLWRLTGQSDIIIGIAYDERNYPELEDALGLFAGQLPISVHLHVSARFSSLLKRTRELLEDAYRLQGYCARDYALGVGADDNPLCLLSFEFEIRPQDYYAGDVALSIEECYACIDRFAVKLNCVQTRDTTLTQFHYDLNLFSVADIQRLMESYHALLISASAHPESIIAELDYVGENQRQQLLIELEDTQDDLCDGVCIHHLFEKQAASRPDGIAVIFEGHHLTYRDLNRRSNQLAHYLQRCGVAPDGLVALYLERSLELIVGMLGVLKAGGAYLPLDPVFPKERIISMLADAGPHAIVSQDQLSDWLRCQEIQITRLDADWERIAEERPENPSNLVTPDNLVYTIYTSGSTGRPKAVAIEHRSLINYVNGVLERLGFPDSYAYATVSTFAADLGNTSIFPSLCSGGCLHVISSDCSIDPNRFSHYFLRHQIDFVKIVPSHIASLLADRLFEQVAPCGTLILGGEACNWKIIDQIKNSKTVPRIFNHYGPTEATIGALIHEITDDFSSHHSAALPLSRSIGNAQIHLLDFDLSPVPNYLSGQIYIGGACLARCYVNRPETTAEKFIPNPFSCKNGARLYQTGDLARYLPDGTLELLGRVDRQVKIAGFRVELGEIEAVLREHWAVREVEVMPVEDESGGKRLVAYLVSHTEPRPAVRDLRDFLKEKLPESTIPSSFVFLDALPLTPNGKLDRQALIKARVELSDEKRLLPAGQLSMVRDILVGIWCDLLGLERVGDHDNFFELGGHSLLAMRLCSRVQSAFSLDFSLNRLFEAPTINELTGAVEATMRAGMNRKTPLIERVSRDQALPLSFAQQRLWFLELLEPNGATYNISIALRLLGRLNAPALEHSFSVVMNRHDVFHTVFQTLGGQPVQIVRQDLSFLAASVDLSRLGREARESIAARLAADDAHRQFDLSEGPPFRVRLLRIDGNDQILLLTIHHIVFDAWSKDLLVRELMTLYSAFQNGDPSPLLESPVQYADFAVLQRQSLQGEYLNNLISYWKIQLTPLPPRLDLPMRQGGLGRRTFVGASQFLTLSPVIKSNLVRLCRWQKSTLFMVTLAALKVLLHRYTGEVDIVVGTPISNRNRVEFEEIIGFFLNMLALRTELIGDPTFSELLARVRKTSLDAYAHQELPFEKLVEELQPGRDLKATPIFQIMFVYQQVSDQGALKLPGLELGQFEFDTRPARYELTFTISESERELAVALEYDTGLYHPNMISGVLGHLRTLLEEIAVNPDRRVSSLPILCEIERRQLTMDWNDTKRDFSENASVSELIEGQVARTPDSVAVVFEDEQLSYGGLNQKANQLANYLKIAGVRPEVKVGVCLERSLTVPVGWLSVLKVGGAYVPLDPAYPAERLAFILNDIRAAVLLTDYSSATRFSQGDIRLIYLDKEWKAIAEQSECNIHKETASDNVAYVIYTSGSTGTPKGVEISQRAVVNFLESMYSQLDLSNHEVLFSATSFSFDIAALELLLPLVIGGRVVIASREAVSSGAGLSTSLMTSAASIMQGTPTIWQIMLESGWRGDKSLNILCGGETLSRELLCQLQERSAQVWNMYGPTETTIWSTALRTGAEPGPVSIGRPINNMEIYLLDARMNPAPIGVKGELYIGGVGLGRGYYNRPELTAEKYIADPIGHGPGQRLYRTGDSARYRTDGNIEFLGRSDGQVKIRGFRIELGEIEAVINRFPNVKQNAVLVREDQPGRKQIMAYIVPANNSELSVGELRRHLMSNLPQHMIPSSVILLDKMPLTPNAKIDRRALPAPDGARPFLEEQYVGPKMPAEEILTNMFSELLGVKQIGIYDNFFDMGGHSLLALKLLSRVRDRFNVDLSLRLLFENPRVSDLAGLLVHQGNTNSRSIPRRNGSGNLAPLSFAQERIWFFEQMEPDTPTYNFPVAAFLNAPLNAGAFEQSINEVIRRHDSLRTAVKIINGRPMQEIFPGPLQALSIIDLRNLPESQRNNIARQMVESDARRPFNLSRPPLLRAIWIRLGMGEQLLLLNTHHLISDVWSMNIIVAEITDIYTSYLDGVHSPLPDLTVQYSDFAIWQRDWLREEVFETQMSYWKKQVGGENRRSTFTTDYPRAPVQTFRGATQQFKIPSSLAESLKALSRREDVTVYMTLLAAFLTLLYRYTGRTDISVGAPVSSRDRTEIEGVIGCFINTLVLRVNLEGHLTFQDLLGRVREVTIGAYTHRHMPFEYLVKELNLERGLGHQPLFQLLFRVDPPRQFAGASVLPLERWNVHNGSAKFDMEWAISGADDDWVLFLNYNIDLYSATTVARLGECYLELLASVADNSDQRLLEIPLEKGDNAVCLMANPGILNKDRFSFEISTY